MCECCGGHVENKFAPAEVILAKYEGIKGSLIPILQAVQDEYGYLPEDVMGYVAEEIDIPLSRIYGVITFYAQFHLKPRGKNIIRICVGTACHVKGAGKIVTAFEEKLGVKAGETTPDLKFTIEPIACVGACGLAPVIMVNHDTYGKLSPKMVRDVLDNY
ncbi:MAG: NADP-reducing hydrogenase subunit HndA [Dehalococcoidia bacterium]|nr:NADP-reducing hydrogenase subunit HndA [Bacillota bacterium]